MRNIKFTKEEYYHIYNRGVDKRSIFEEPADLLRFLQSMREFNTIDPIGSLHLNSLKIRSSAPKLVRFVGYCLNQNHYHFILQPLVENGVQSFMHRLSTGYTNYFNIKYERSGSLFQGKYKAIYISTNEYLLHLSVYVNLNDRVHGDVNIKWLLELPFSSFKEYKFISIKNKICDTSLILSQFESIDAYCHYAESTLEDIIRRKKQDKQLRNIIID